MVESFIVKPLTGNGPAIVSFSEAGNRYDQNFDYIYEAFCRWSSLSSAIAPAPRNKQPTHTSILEAGRVEVVGVACAWAYERLSALSAPKYYLARLRDVFRKCDLNTTELPNAHLAAFESWIEGLLYDAHAQNVLIAFSGHGVILDRELLLGFADTDPSNFGGTAFPISRLADLTVEAQVRHVVLMLDCCFAGASAESLDLAGGSLADLFQRDQSSITLLAAAASNQAAYAPVGQVSFFTGFFADAIERCLRNGKGLTLVQASDEIASALTSLNLGQVHWRFLSQVSHRLMLVNVRTDDDVIPQLKAIGLRQKSSLQTEWDSVRAKLPSIEKTFVLKKQNGVIYGLVFGCPTWTERFLPTFSWLILFMTTFILAYNASELLSAFPQSLMGLIILLGVSFLMIKILEGSGVSLVSSLRVQTES